MKRILLLAACIAMLATLFGCATAPQTPAQIAARACPLVTDELSTLSQAGLFTGGAQDTLTSKIQPAVDKVCVASSTVTQVNLQSLSKDVAPLLINIVNASQLAKDDKSKAVLVIGTIQAMIDTALATVVPTSTAPASGAVAS
ncbi:hypothetical protein RI103_13970 [Paraburkholderia sp. FT54]|uniref:hypothetical protein n=1 Tax=Paraburkholderia sp. FT54 TaxID=3074437 RepID=UPI002877489F|nr:hypothetical protein [Paraburkholderia sp. FT54]WNC88807.1 hypothetical protein RI103_13970 [Paraburkholderia sp. FT54]